MMQTCNLTEDQLPFDLDLTLSCGQVFRWEQSSAGWTGQVNGAVVTIRQEGRSLIYHGMDEETLIRYFNLSIHVQDLLQMIRTSIARYSGRQEDSFFEIAARRGAGLRIIRQDPWECLISFICSQNSNIPTISKRISLICRQYGKKLNDNWYGFPDPAELAGADEGGIRTCCTGYRAPYLIRTAQAITSDPKLLARIDDLQDEDARQELMKLSGVGPKVADCVLLFAYNRYQVVPVDVWVRTIITGRYPQVQDRKGNRKECSYHDIAEFCRDYFGRYAGYAQQYFFASRLNLPQDDGLNQKNE